VAEAKSELLAAIKELDGMLRRSGAYGEGWKEFLHWQEMREELERREGPDLSALDAIYNKYASGHNGLQLAEFAGVRRALRRYLTTARAVGDESLADDYRQLLDALSEHLKAYHDSPTTERALLIGQAVRWLEEAGQAPELIEAIRRYFSQPNVFLQVSPDFLAGGIAGPVDEGGAVSDWINGTQVSGKEHTTGEITIELIPRDEHARVDVIFRGTIESDTVGRNGPARIYAHSVTQVATRKPIKIEAKPPVDTEDGRRWTDKRYVWTDPARTNAETETTIKDVQVSRGGARGEQTARQQVNAQKRQSEQAAARRAAKRTSQRVDERTDEKAEQLDADYKEKFLKPLVKRDLYPQHLRFYTTEQALHGVALHGGVPGLGAAGSPPAVEGEPDVVVRLHESMLNNFAGAALAGMIAEEETVRTQLTELFGSTPAWLEPDEETAPWTIIFARRHPITVTFGDGGFVVTLRGRQYVRGEDSYPGMHVTAEYKIEHTEEGPKAVRQGGLKILPPGFRPEEGEKLSARQQVLRTLLEERFGNIFTEEMVPEPFSLTGAWEKAGELRLTGWEASDGWTVLRWNLAPRAEQEAEAPATAQTP
jgi:hypothetical protein